MISPIRTQRLIRLSILLKNIQTRRINLISLDICLFMVYNVIVKTSQAQRVLEVSV